MTQGLFAIFLIGMGSLLFAAAVFMNALSRLYKDDQPEG